MATLPKTFGSTQHKPSTVRGRSVGPVDLKGARTLSVSKAKTNLLSVLSELETTRESVTLTKRGRPIAKIVPFTEKPWKSGFGCMKGTATILGDIVSPDHEAWKSKS